MYSLLQVNVWRVLCLFSLSLVIMMGNVAGMYSSTSNYRIVFPHIIIIIAILL